MFVQFIMLTRNLTPLAVSFSYYASINVPHVIPKCQLIFQISAGCDPPFEEVEGICYYYNSALYVDSYIVAQQQCQEREAHLAIVKSGEENRAIIENLLVQNSKIPNCIMEHLMVHYADVR